MSTRKPCFSRLTVSPCKVHNMFNDYFNLRKSISLCNVLDEQHYNLCLCNNDVNIVIAADFHRAMVASAPGRITPHMAPPYEELDLRHEFERLF